jgi:metallo-beta-lactamase class B
MRNLFYLFFILLSLKVYSQSDKTGQTIQIARDLKILKLSQNSLIHISTATSPQFGTYTSNGLIYINGNEAVVMDTPGNNKQAKQLLDWFQKEYQGVKIKAVVVNHFHDDCLGGLKEFHQRGISSYSTKMTAELARKDSSEVPQNTFDKSMELRVGKSRIINNFPGEAHSRDNIVTWIPKEKILFGGCMVKTLNASKGNLSDANQEEWANTISMVKEMYNDAKIVIPGHGNFGGTELLDYTIQLFQVK